MIDITLLREKTAELKKATADKQLDPSVVDRALELDKKWREQLQKVEELRAERNIIADEMKIVEDDNKRKELIETGKALKEKAKSEEDKLNELEIDREEAIKKIPNLIAEDVPYGESEDDNKVLREWGEPTEFDFEPEDHVDIGKELGIIEIEKAAEVSGARFAYLLGDAATLQFALISYTLEILTDYEILANIAKKAGIEIDTKPFIPVVPPVMIRPEVFDQMDRLHPSEDRFYTEKDDLYLIGSAEHTLGPLHMNETFSSKELPMRYIGYSTAFRREAGSYGRDTRGILRVHQFDKLEMETFTFPEEGRKEQDFIVAIQEYLMQSLEIPYQVIAISTGDMGKPDFRQIDLNAWLPGQDKYRETHTSDYMTDYQSRRLNTKVQRKGQSEYVHMNDATAFAIGRTIIAILENYQQKDGSILVPEVLRKYIGKEVIGAKNK